MKTHMNLATVGRLLTAVGVVAVLSACTNIQKGMAIGGAAGAAAGTAAGALWWESISAGEGALIGAGLGSVYGGLIGADMNAQDYERLQKELDNLKQQCAAKGQDNDALLKRIEDLERQSKKGPDMSQLEDAMKKIKDLEGVVDKMEKTPRGIEMTILGDALFASGKASLTAEGKQKLDAVIAVVKKEFPNNEIGVEGHTDSQPIKKSGWRSNWELGAARAQEVLHYLIDQHQLQPAKLSATTFGEYRPVADNASKDGMKRNRRAVIVIYSQPADALAHQAKG